MRIQQTPRLPVEPRPIVMIGAGGIARDAHLPAYRKARFRVAAIHDREPARAAELARTFGIPAVPERLDEAADYDPDEVVFDVAVPARALPEVLPALPDGAAVLIQKPMGEDLAQAGVIRDLCRAKGMTASVNFQLRFAPFVIAARDLLEQGLLGTLHDVEIRMTVYTPWHLWTFLEGIPRVEILYHSIHYLDLIRSFLGDPGGVYAKTLGAPGNGAIANTRSSIILDYGDTIRANVQANHGHRYGLRHQEGLLKLEGTAGAVWVRVGLNLDYPTGVPDVFEYCLLQEDEPPTWQTLALEGSWFPDGFIGTMASLQCYLDGSRPTLTSSVEDAYRTMALVEAAYASSAAGGMPIVYTP